MIASKKTGDIYSANGKRIPAQKTKQFDYQASVNDGKRRSGPKRLKSEQATLNLPKRRKMEAAAWDQLRNYAVVAWAIRRHVSYVSQFNFKIRTPDDELTSFFRNQFRRRMKRRNFDVAEMHNFNSAFALREIGKVCSGDHLMLKLPDMKVQLIDSTRIAKPDKARGKRNLPKRVVNQVTDEGLIINNQGKITDFCICGYDPNDGKTLEYQALVPRESAIYSGYFIRGSQNRGVSPLSSALNQFQDLYESWQYTLMKQRVHALLGFAFYRDLDGEETGLPYQGSPAYQTDPDGAVEDDGGYDIKLDGNLLNLDLEPGDKVDLLESKTPHTDTVEFWATQVRAALLALDIPFTAFDGRESSFSHTLSDRADYERSAKEKQQANMEDVEEWRDWQLMDMLANNPQMARLAESLYNTEDDLCEAICPVATGMPWINRKDQATAAATMLSNGLTSRQRLCREQNLDFFEIADELGEEQSYLEDRGVIFSIGQPGSPIAGEESTDGQPDEEPAEQPQNEESIDE